MHILTRHHGFNAQHNPRVVQFVGSNTSGGSTVTAPSDIRPGDVLALSDRANNSSGIPSTVTPTGWTTPANANFSLTDHRSMFSYKLADGSEGGTTITGMNGNAGNNKIIAAFRANVPITSISAPAFTGAMTDGNPSAIVLSIAALQTPLLVFGCYGAGTAVDPRSFTPAADGEITASVFFHMKYKIYNAAPADTTIDMDDESSRQGLLGGYLLLS